MHQRYSCVGPLKRYVIVRDIPEIGSKSQNELSDISQASCKALKETGLESVQWQHSYVAGDKWVVHLPVICNDISSDSLALN